jgi:hypothetical protein
MIANHYFHRYPVVIQPETQAHNEKAREGSHYAHRDEGLQESGYIHDDNRPLGGIPSLLRAPHTHMSTVERVGTLEGGKNKKVVRWITVSASTLIGRPIANGKKMIDAS